MALKVDPSLLKHSEAEWSIVGTIVGTVRRKNDDAVLCAQITEVPPHWVLVTFIAGSGLLEDVANTTKRIQGEFGSLADAIKATDALFEEWLGE